MSRVPLLALLITACSASTNPATVTGQGDTALPGPANECTGWQKAHTDWIFCDDFESTGPMIAPGRYFEYGDDDGDLLPLDGIGVRESRGLRVKWETGEVGAGGFKLSFGRNPNSYMNTGIRGDEDFREVYYRMYLRHQEGWQGSPAKLSRVTVFSSADSWAQAMIAHLWSDSEERLLLDPASCVRDGEVVCEGYNDFDQLGWLGFRSGRTAIFSTDDAGRWRCVEAHVRLNDPGEANGVHEFWIDGQLEARRDGLDFVGTYTDYAINAIFFENYWNGGSSADQERYFDNIVVSTAPIGCR